MDECLIFQKLTSQENIIISALDHLEKTKMEDTYEDNEDVEDDDDL
jgi:hypothetical protein